jgi:hypothetical protein
VGIDEIPELFCSEKIRLEKAGNMIEDFDLMIGTTGVTSNLVVVTHNIKHFNRIEGIEYELACLILPSLNKREKLSGNTKQGFGGVGIKKEKST